jgi:putative spermidine/putrescine transport system ATP-binding protein
MSVVFENVSFGYPGTNAGVRSIDLEIAPGEIVAVIGPSGSGKTTLLKLLSGFLKPDTGRIFLNGHDISDRPPEKRNVGIVFQSYALFPHMSVADNVAYPLKVRKIPSDERGQLVRKALERVGLPGHGDRAPDTLSGGQQQRVALARALIFSPGALLLDEPLSALDASLRAGMRDEIMRVQQEAGIATLFVTHDQEEALSLGRRVAVMFEGRLVQVDEPRALYDGPLDARVAAFVGNANLFEATVLEDGLVNTAIGRLTTSTKPHVSGDKVIAMVRPERVLPVPGGSRSAKPQNQLQGTISKDRFLGAIRRFDLEVAGGMVQGETTIRDPICMVSIPPEAIRLLPAFPTNTSQQTRSAP